MTNENNEIYESLDVARQEEYSSSEEEASGWEQFESTFCPAGAKLVSVGVSFGTGKGQHGCYSSEDCYNFLYNLCENDKTLERAVADCGTLSCGDRTDFITGAARIEQTLYGSVLEIPVIGDIVGRIFNKVDCSEGMIAEYSSPTKVRCSYPDNAVELLQLPVPEAANVDI